MNPTAWQAYLRAVKAADAEFAAKAMPLRQTLQAQLQPLLAQYRSDLAKARNAYVQALGADRRRFDR